jgi:O-antigen/teichoic acid export membrane protein
MVSIFSLGIRVGGSLLTLPLALRLVPATELGLYYTFLGITAMATLLDFGLGSTVARNCTYAYSGAKRLDPLGLPPMSEKGGPNFDLLSELTAACKSYYYWIGAFLAVILVVGGGLFIHTQIVREGMPLHLMGAWLLFALTSAHAFGTGFWNNFLIGIGEVGLAARIGLASQLIGLTIVIGGLFAGLGIWSYGLGMGISGILARHLAKKEYLKRILQKPSTGWNQHKQILRTMWPMAWRQGLVLVGAFLIQRFGTLLVTSELGLERAATYGLTIQVQAVIFQVCGVPLLIAMPHITRWRLEGNIVRVKKEFFTRAYLGLVMAGFLLMILAYQGQALLTLIGSNTPLLAPPLFILCAIFGILELHTVAYNHLVLAENRNPFVYPVLITGVASVFIGMIAVKYWGIAGVILASGAAQSAFIHWFVVIHGFKVFRIKSISTAKAALTS